MKEPARALRVFRLAPLFAAGAGLALFVDIPLARFSWLNDAPGDFQKALQLSEIFGHGFGVGIICVAIAVLDQVNRRKLPRFLGCAFLPGLAAHFFKLVIGRARPNGELQNGEMVLPETVQDTFVGWFAGFSDSAMQSFPSGHTTTAVGCAIGLTWIYPRGKWLFASLALLVAMQRIESGAHFASDTFAAAALACIVAGLCVNDRGIGRWFSRWENRSPP